MRWVSFSTGFSFEVGPTSETGEAISEIVADNTALIDGAVEDTGGLQVEDGTLRYLEV